MDVLYNEYEEINLPERCTVSVLDLWSKIRNQEQPVNKRPALDVDMRNFLQAEQHQHGLSSFMKRCRRCKADLPDLLPKANPNLPIYLQDVEKFNVELMNRTTTRVHNRLPTMEVISQEKEIAAQSTKKAWKHGLVVTEHANLVDPNWRKAEEEKYVRDSARQTSDKTPAVMAGVLHHWQR